MFGNDEFFFFEFIERYHDDFLRADDGQNLGTLFPVFQGIGQKRARNCERTSTLDAGGEAFVRSCHRTETTTWSQSWSHVPSDFQKWIARHFSLRNKTVRVSIGPIGSRFPSRTLSDESIDRTIKTAVNNRYIEGVHSPLLLHHTTGNAEERSSLKTLKQEFCQWRGKYFYSLPYFGSPMYF